MTIDEIIEGCQLGGISLEQRLAVVSFSILPRNQEEEKLIVEYLARRKETTLSQVLASQGITTTRDSQTDTDGKRGWWDRDDNQMGRFDVVEGWEIAKERGWI